MEHCRSPDGVTSVSMRPYYTMLSHVILLYRPILLETAFSEIHTLALARLSCLGCERELF